MALHILIIIGVLMFIAGLYLLIKNYMKGKYIKGYGFLAYFGLATIVLGVILSMESFFTSLPGTIGNTLPAGIAMIIFIISGKLLLKPINKK